MARARRNAPPAWAVQLGVYLAPLFLEMAGQQKRKFFDPKTPIEWKRKKVIQMSWAAPPTGFWVAYLKMAPKQTDKIIHWAMSRDGQAIIAEAETAAGKMARDKAGQQLVMAAATAKNNGVVDQIAKITGNTKETVRDIIRLLGQGKVGEAIKRYGRGTVRNVQLMLGRVNPRVEEGSGRLELVMLSDVEEEAPRSRRRLKPGRVKAISPPREMTFDEYVSLREQSGPKVGPMAALPRMSGDDLNSMVSSDTPLAYLAEYELTFREHKHALRHGPRTAANPAYADWSPPVSREWYKKPLPGGVVVDAHGVRRLLWLVYRPDGRLYTADGVTEAQADRIIEQKKRERSEYERSRMEAYSAVSGFGSGRRYNPRTRGERRALTAKAREAVLRRIAIKKGLSPRRIEAEIKHMEWHWKAGKDGKLRGVHTEDELRRYLAKKLAGVEGGHSRRVAKKRKKERTRAARREGKKEIRRNPRKSDVGMYQDILAHLRALQWVYTTTHWTSSGPNAYGDHLLLQRLYEGLDKPIDALGERMVAYFGPDSVDPSLISSRVKKILHHPFQLKRAAMAGTEPWASEWPTHISDPRRLRERPREIEYDGTRYTQWHEAAAGRKGLSNALQWDTLARLDRLERSLQRHIKAAWKANQDSGDEFSLGIDDYLMGLANERDEAIYLLKQRLGGGSGARSNPWAKKGKKNPAKKLVWEKVTDFRSQKRWEAVDHEGNKHIAYWSSGGRKPGHRLYKSPRGESWTYAIIDSDGGEQAVQGPYTLGEIKRMAQESEDDAWEYRDAFNNPKRLR